MYTGIPFVVTGYKSCQKLTGYTSMHCHLNQFLTRWMVESMRPGSPGFNPVPLHVGQAIHPNSLQVEHGVRLVAVVWPLPLQNGQVTVELWSFF